MRQIIRDILYQLNIESNESFNGVAWCVDTGKKYIHYDELECFTKFNYFKGIRVNEKNNIELQFLD